MTLKARWFGVDQCVIISSYLWIIKSMGHGLQLAQSPLSGAVWKYFNQLFPDHAVSISRTWIADPAQRNLALWTKLRRVEKVSIVEAIEIQSNSALIQGILSGLAAGIYTTEILPPAKIHLLTIDKT